MVTCIWCCKSFTLTHIIWLCKPIATAIAQSILHGVIQISSLASVLFQHPNSYWSCMQHFNIILYYAGCRGYAYSYGVILLLRVHACPCVYGTYMIHCVSVCVCVCVCVPVYMSSYMFVSLNYITL